MAYPLKLLVAGILWTAATALLIVYTFHPVRPFAAWCLFITAHAALMTASLLLDTFADRIERTVALTEEYRHHRPDVTRLRR